MSGRTSDDQSDISAKLDTIIRLIAHSTVAPYASLKDKIMALHNAGLATRDIADVVGSTTHSVSQTISAAKKLKSEKKTSSKKKSRSRP